MCLCAAPRSERVVRRDKPAEAPHPSTRADVNRCRSGQPKSSAMVLVDADKWVFGLFILQRSGKTDWTKRGKRGASSLIIYC